MFYMIAYVLTSLASFGMILLLSREGFEADQLDDFKGLNQRSPWWAFMMLLVMFSLAGLPPTVGFYAKFSVIAGGGRRAASSGSPSSRVLASLIGAFYYLRIVKLMYFDEPVGPRADRGARRHARAAVGQRPRAAGVRHPAAAADGLCASVGAGAVAVLAAATR